MLNEDGSRRSLDGNSFRTPPAGNPDEGYVISLFNNGGQLIAQQRIDLKSPLFAEIDIKEQARRLVSGAAADDNRDYRVTRPELASYKPQNDLEKEAVARLQERFEEFAKTASDPNNVSLQDAMRHNFADPELNQALKRLKNTLPISITKEFIDHETKRLTDDMRQFDRIEASDQKQIDELRDVLSHFDETKKQLEAGSLPEGAILESQLRSADLESVSDPDIKRGLAFLQGQRSDMTKEKVKEMFQLFNNSEFDF